MKTTREIITGALSYFIVLYKMTSFSCLSSLKVNKFWSISKLPKHE